jgi:thiamine-monophosphate kinase
MAERARIARFFAPLAAGEPGSFQLMDDAASLTPPPGQRLILTTDSVIEGLHVPMGASPEDIARKLVRRNLSDLAAMGAQPWRYSLNLHTPRGQADDWFARFADTLAAEQTRYGMILVGGDSTSGEASACHATLTCLGLCDGALLLRNGARAGEDIYVSGTLGDAAYALTLLQQNASVPPALLARYLAPEPRLALGQALRGIATAAVDISDGLLADLSQLLAASGVGADVLRDTIPLSLALREATAHDETCWQHALSGGDDYELCFSAPVIEREAIAALAARLDLPLTRIGTVMAQRELAILDARGKKITPTAHGWEHG